MRPAIRVQELSKQYRLGTARPYYGRHLREVLGDSLKGVWGRLARRQIAGPAAAAAAGEFWALKDVSFDIRPGEVVGIIGRNGAGKSTLLKILSRIVEPTRGRAEVRGRMGSLLEVGTGFHPELTGRENIYLNGSLLGMTRKEIERKFDAIVAFSEIESFLDTPVKRYSSGMYVRLAFAVAAHLEPELLVVDEVLAVGDAQFQQKCLGKIGQVGRTGRTVLFVSHNMTAVKALCSRCIYLVDGRVAADATPEVAIGQYMAVAHARSGQEDLRSHPGRAKDCLPLMSGVRLLGPDGQVTSTIPMGGCLSVEVAFSSPAQGLCPVLGVVIKDHFGAALFGINNRIIPGYHFATPLREGKITCRYERLPLMPGAYAIDLYLGNSSVDLDVIPDAVSFDVLPVDLFGSGRLPPPSAGPIWVPASWAVESSR